MRQSRNKTPNGSRRALINAIMDIITSAESSERQCMHLALRLGLSLAC